MPVLHFDDLTCPQFVVTSRKIGQSRGSSTTRNKDVLLVRHHSIKHSGKSVFGASTAQYAHSERFANGLGRFS